MKTNFQIVTEHYAASARQDIAAMMADASPEVAWTEMAGFPCAGTWIGPDQVIANVLDVLGSEWEGYNFTLERSLMVASNWSASARMLAPIARPASRCTLG